MFAIAQRARDDEHGRARVWIWTCDDPNLDGRHYYLDPCHPVPPRNADYILIEFEPANRFCRVVPLDSIVRKED